MAINLKKGERIDLTKGNANLRQILVGLGWDSIKQSKGGFWKSLFSGGSQIDCDSSVLMLDSEDKLRRKDDLVYYSNLKHSSDSVHHMGDNLTGEGEGDDEQIHINLPDVPSEIHRLVFAVNIYNCRSRKQDFGMIQNAFIRIVDRSSNQELVRFNLTENYAGQTALIVGEVYRDQADWKFAAVGEGTTDVSISEISGRYQ